MPVIKRFDATALMIFFNDHAPPHFHVRTADRREALVNIDTLEITTSKLSQRELREVLEWAEANRETLMDKWEELNP